MLKKGLLLFCMLFLFSGALAAAEAKTLYGRGSKRAHQVELYTTSWCPYCRKAEAFLKANGISYTNYDIEKDEAAAARKKKLDRRKGVPLAIINGQKIYGYSERMYRTALDLD